MTCSLGFYDSAREKVSTPIRFVGGGPTAKPPSTSPGNGKKPPDDDPADGGDHQAQTDAHARHDLGVAGRNQPGDDDARLG